MKHSSFFFKKKNKLKIFDICKKIKAINPTKDCNINNIKDLNNANVDDISFFNSLKYLDVLKKSKAKFIITQEKNLKFIKNFCKPIVVENVFKAVAEITELFYPNSLNYNVDFNLVRTLQQNLKQSVNDEI